MMKLKLRVPTRGRNKEKNSSVPAVIGEDNVTGSTTPQSSLEPDLVRSENGQQIIAATHNSNSPHNFDDVFDARYSSSFQNQQQQYDSIDRVGSNRSNEYSSNRSNEYSSNGYNQLPRSVSSHRSPMSGSSPTYQQQTQTQQQHYVVSNEEPHSIKIVGAAAATTTVNEARPPTDTIHIPNNTKGRNSLSRPRSRHKSAGRNRPSSVQPHRPASGENRFASDDNNNYARHVYNSGQASTEPDDSSEPETDKKRKSKLEKIRQLQTKNELYKEEYKRVQKDRKQLKKDIELKKEEIMALNDEITAHISETSSLKNKLAQTMQQLSSREQVDHGEVTKLSKELSQVRSELDASLQRVADAKEEMETLREQVIRKDQQITSLTDEVSFQANVAEELQAENAKYKSIHRREESTAEEVRHLKEENGKLHKELGSTLERAASMVKEREDAISDLLKENDEMKKLLTIREETIVEKPQIDEEELNMLKEDLNRTHAQLEEAQDRNVLLEEEIEEWMNRGSEMEHEIERLRDEVEDWTVKHEESMRTIALLEKSENDAKNEAENLRTALTSAENKFNTRMAETEIKHRAILLEERDKTHQALESLKLLSVDSDDKSTKSGSEKKRGDDLFDKQASFLEQAVANRQRKAVPEKSAGWLSGFRRQGDEGEEMDENQKRIRELEMLNSEQEKELQKLKSEIVKMRSTYNEQLYTNKKTIERLEHESEAYALKAKQLEAELEKRNS